MDNGKNLLRQTKIPMKKCFLKNTCLYMILKRLKSITTLCRSGKNVPHIRGKQTYAFFRFRLRSTSKTKVAVG